ncbi:MAG TPA: hypothetical protein VGA45_16695 [Actinomycetota bacterium]
MRTGNHGPAGEGGCSIEIRIESRGDVNIYNCAAPCRSGQGGPPPEGDHACPPVAPGACVPVSLGSKPKQSRRRKLDRLLANTRVPSALGASFFHLARRHLAGKAAANPLEEQVFAALRRLPPDLRRLLGCARDSLDALPPGHRDRLFSPDLLRDVDQPLDAGRLTQAFAQEIVENVGVGVFGDPRCVAEEQPGQVRTPPFPGGEFPPAPVRVCRVNRLRTASFRPPLAPGDYTPDEVQQRCRVVLEGSEPKQVCEVQTTGCPGQDVGVCLRVQEVEAGQAVLLEGVNFSSVGAKVRLTGVAAPGAAREVDALVCGDDETPRTEVVDGTAVLITDCRVRDRLTFHVPDDLPPGIYDIQVLVPNAGAVPGWGAVLSSDGVRAIAVVPPSTARFQIASETLHCRAETSPASLGSDEVGIRILAVPLFPDLTAGEPQAPNGGKPIRFGDVDSGETRGMVHLLFSHQQPIAGAALSITGHEVDGEEAFEKQIDSFTDAYVEILKDQLKLAAAGLAAAGGISKLSALGMKGLIAAAIAAAVVLAVDVFVALWAPADLIIEDAIGPTTQELVQLTSANFPPPSPSEHVTAQGIKVKVTPLEKVPQQYRERREYISDDEESRYEIVLRYNRVA